MFILAISHVLNVTQSKFYHICKGTLNHHTFVIYKLFEHFLFKLCTFWETWFLRAGKLKMFISAISHVLNVTQSKFYQICKGTLNHHTFVIYKQFEHFLFKLCTFWATWFLRAGMLKMFILAISHVLYVTQSKFYHICKGTLNHHTFVIYKQFEHFLFKLCTFWATWFLRAGMLKMFIYAREQQYLMNIFSKCTFSHRANFITYAREHWTIIHLSFTSSLNIFSSSYAHFEQLGSLELECLKCSF